MSDQTANDYQWDVFLSYSREALVDQWVRESFKELLTFWLSQELGGTRARVFFDQDAIQPGDDWADVIARGIRASKCLVAVWTPSYFTSEWCMTEWKSFRERCEVEKLGPAGLAAPVLWCDGEYIPPDASVVQYADFRDFARVGAAFKNSERYLGLQDEVALFAKQVARAVRRAPPYCDDWPVVDLPEPLAHPPIPQPRL